MGSDPAGPKRYAVIGDPVAHSLSPAIHRAAFAELDIDAQYVAHLVRAGAVSEAIAEMRAGRWHGFSVTMPHKHEVLGACDELTPAAAALDAVNCVFWSGGLIVGDNTDGEGFVRGLIAELDVDPMGLRCCVVGAGGAARAVVRALAAAGAVQVAVLNRSADRAVAAAHHGGEVGVVAETAHLGAADLVVNATPLGMAGTDHAGAIPFAIDLLSDTAVVCDLIYHPVETRLLAQARARGLRAQNGIAMLVYQAATQFEHWTGQPAPISAMTSALTKLSVTVFDA